MKRRRRAFAAGSEIAFESEEAPCVLCVCDGWLTLSKTLEDGRTQIIDFVLAGDITLPGGADGVTSSYRVAALTDVRIAAFTRPAWMRLEAAVPHLREIKERLGAAAQARIAERMLRLGKGNAPMRIAYALLELYVRLRVCGAARADRFHIPMGQQQLGDFTGLSSVHVCRTLRRFARSGIVSVRDHMDIRIQDQAALSRIAGIEAEHLAAEIAPPARIWRA